MANFGVIVFPGSNCDHDAYHALKHVMNADVKFLWHKDTDLSDIDFLIVPGGFSYGDYLRSGAIARFSPIMQEVVKFAEKGGPVMGICNGFQILLEAGLIPGAMMHNNKLRFVCKSVNIRVENTESMFTSHLKKGQVLNIPVSHGEGNYFLPEDELQKLEDNDQVIFRYSDANCEVNAASNPNGAINNIAGVCNDKKNVFGMMPHPERACTDDLGNTDGVNILRGLLEVVELA